MEIVLRAAVIFFFLWLITRIVGRATLGELSTFELLIYVTMGDLAQQAVTQQDYSVTGAMLAVGTFAVITILISLTNFYFPKTRAFIRGVPVVVVSGGQPLLPAMRRERLTVDDLNAAARQQGIAQISDVRFAVLEANGQLSFFTNDGAQDGAPQQPSVG